MMNDTSLKQDRMDSDCILSSVNRREINSLLGLVCLTIFPFQNDRTTKNHGINYKTSEMLLLSFVSLVATVCNKNPFILFIKVTVALVCM